MCSFCFEEQQIVGSWSPLWPPPPNSTLWSKGVSPEQKPASPTHPPTPSQRAANGLTKRGKQPLHSRSWRWLRWCCHLLWLKSRCVTSVEVIGFLNHKNPAPITSPYFNGFSMATEVLSSSSRSRADPNTHAAPHPSPWPPIKTRCCLVFPLLFDTSRLHQILHPHFCCSGLLLKCEVL